MALRHSLKFRSLLFLFFTPLLLAAAAAPQKSQSGRAVRFKDSGWWLYRNGRQGFSLRLPPQLKVNFVKTNSPKWSADNRMPFDYVNFRPQPEDPAASPFELGVGVHWNRDGLGTREFADKKDEGLMRDGAQIETVRHSEALVCGITGVRDDFRLRQPYGWQSYSRVIIPCKDKFLVFLGTLGADNPLPDHERVYQKILDSFTLE